MFAVLFSFLLYALLTFGGVLPQNWFFLNLLWIVCITAYLVYRILSTKPFPAALLLSLFSALLLLALLPTRIGIGLVAALWASSAVALNHKRTHRFFLLLFFLGLFEALLGLTQFFISPGWIFGYVNAAFRSSGTLINHNHFAGLLEMLIPVAVGCAYISLQRYNAARAYTYLLGGAFMGLALVFSVSRMGIFSFLVTMLALLLLLRLRESSRRVATGLALGLTALVVGGVAWIGFDVIASRYQELIGEEAILREGRLILYRDTIKMITANPSGVGNGNYQDRFRQFQTFRPELLFDHAHNDYLETMAEWGIVPALAFWTVVLFVLTAAIRTFLSPVSPERCGILLTCIGAIFSILLHSLTDFNLQIPSNSMLFFVFVGIAVVESFPQVFHANSDTSLEVTAKA